MSVRAFGWRRGWGEARRDEQRRGDEGREARGAISSRLSDLSGRHVRWTKCMFIYQNCLGGRGSLAKRTRNGWEPWENGAVQQPSREARLPVKGTNMVPLHFFQSPRASHLPRRESVASLVEMAEMGRIPKPVGLT